MSRVEEDITGKIFGDFIAIKPSHKKITTNKNVFYFWEFKCLLCGIIKIKNKRNMNRKYIPTCSCNISKKLADRNKVWKKKGSSNITGTYISQIRNRANSRGIEFKIDVNYLQQILEKQNFKCALSNVSLIMTNEDKRSYFGRLNPNNGSLDRIDSNKGYIEGNVQWVHKDINFMKQALDQDKFIEWCKIITEYQSSIKKFVNHEDAIIEVADGAVCNMKGECGG